MVYGFLLELFFSSLCKVNIVPHQDDAEVCREMSRFSNVFLTHVLSFLCANYKVSTETKEIVFLNLKYSFLVNVSRLDHNDPSKPSHRLTNGLEPSKTIESDGNNIKKPS